MNNHRSIRDNARPGDILLSRGIKDPISTIIQGLTKSNWSHSFLYIGDNKIIESERYGVRVEPLDRYLNDKLKEGLYGLRQDWLKKKD